MSTKLLLNYYDDGLYIFSPLLRVHFINLYLISWPAENRLLNPDIWIGCRRHTPKGATALSSNLAPKYFGTEMWKNITRETKVLTVKWLQLHQLKKTFFQILWKSRCHFLVTLPSHLKKLHSIPRFWLKKLNCGFFNSF